MVFMVISVVCALNDLYLLYLEDQNVMRWPLLVFGNAVADVFCGLVAIHMWRLLHGLHAEQPRSFRAPSKELEIDRESLLRTRPSKGKGRCKDVLRPHL